MVWGSGFLSPGGSDLVLELVALVGITPAMSVLEIGAGIGGVARTLVQQYGIWIDCHEESDDCVRVGNELCKMAGAANRVRLTRYDPGSIELGAGAWDCIVSREALYRIGDKSRLIDELRKGTYILETMAGNPHMSHEGGDHGSQSARQAPSRGNVTGPTHGPFPYRGSRTRLVCGATLE